MTENLAFRRKSQASKILFNSFITTYSCILISQTFTQRIARRKVAGSKPPESVTTLSDMVKVVMLKTNPEAWYIGSLFTNTVSGGRKSTAIICWLLCSGG